MIPPPSIGAMSSNRVILGELFSSRARLRFPGQLRMQHRLPLVETISANGTQGLLTLSHSTGSHQDGLETETGGMVLIARISDDKATISVLIRCR